MIFKRGDMFDTAFVAMSNGYEVTVEDFQPLSDPEEAARIYLFHL